MSKITIYSKHTDLTLFLIISLIIIMSSQRVTVYHHVFVTDIHLYRMNINGERIKEMIVNIPRILGYGDFKEDIFWKSVENSINNNMAIQYNQFNYEPGTQFIWIIHYSYNSTKKDKTRRYIFEADGKGKLRYKYY